MRRLAKRLATLGGLGRLPAPGTWGSAVGVILGWGLLHIASAPWRWSALAMMIALSVAICGLAEQLLGRHDAPEIILDEVCAMAALVALAPLLGQIPVLSAVAFGLFRAFDIFKPPPLKRLAQLPGGWGIVLDDVGAAAYTLLVLGLILWWVRRPM